MSSPAEVAERRAAVRHLAKTGASNRAIADQLGIGKDTVARDMSQVDDPRAPMAQRLARAVAQADAAVAQASAAVQAVSEARPAYTLADDETARRWCGALRAAADELAAQADAFADYYPCATG
ncbi:helix-turn-helix domain-containing protein [Streptomyces sp. NPDC085929]|uniref:helix-turn-helix domain-containing protein n=1 Tax=Streptomyces sp. NPDC085929 TaxID=3365739 RepID=UPI0037D2B591